jgi:hypothetical protein
MTLFAFVILLEASLGINLREFIAHDNAKKNQK